jgi:hypothetical protein
MIRLIWITVITLTLVTSSSGQTLDIPSTIDYINQTSAEKGRYYPYFQIKDLVNGELIIEFYYCGSVGSYRNWGTSPRFIKELTECDENKTEWMVRHRIILEKLLLPDPTSNQGPRFELEYRKDDNLIRLTPKQLWNADKVVYCHYYNFDTEEYEEVKVFYYKFHFLGDDYARDKLVNALNHLFSLIAASPEKYTRNKNDSDPFAPHNYNR